MKNTFNIFKSVLFVSVIMLSLYACDRDFTTIESDIEGIKNFENNSSKFPVVAYNKQLNPVQTNSLSSNLLGVYNDPIYGKTIASVVSQVVPSTFSFNFGDNPVVDSVVLVIPYYSKNTGTDDDGDKIYELDSIFGNQKIKLSVFQNNYFLRDFNPETNLEESQNYYSNANETINFDNHIGELLYVNDNLIPSNEELNITSEQTAPPGIHVELLNTNNFWDDLFFFGEDDPASMPELSNQNNFKNYFRGVYLKIEELPDSDGNMAMMNFQQAYIQVYYSFVTGTEIDEDTGDLVEITEQRFIRMNFSGNRLNILENDPTNTIISDADANANPNEGDDVLYLKGGEGSYAIIDLFNGEIQDENGDMVDAFDYFKSKKDTWLINEANLYFYVDQTIFNDQEPDRVILYDLKNNTPIIDYFFDSSTNNSNPLNSKINFSKKLERDDDDNGVKYKLRLTEHLNNILLRDSLNVNLGLYVSTNVNDIQRADVLNSPDEYAPSGTVLSPRGTALYGTSQNVPSDKKVQFEIYFTEPNN